MSPRYDLLLEYLSAKHAGRWEDLKAAVEAVEATGLDKPVAPWRRSVVIRNLSDLAHVEIAYGTDLRWTVCPPALIAIHHDEAQRAALCGSRTDDLLKSLSESAKQAEATISTSLVDLAPPLIEIRASSEEVLARISEETGVPFNRGAANRLLHLLPSIQDLVRSSPECPMPTGYELSRFDVAQFQWVTVALVDRDGSYQVNEYRKSYYVVRDQVLRRVEPGVATFAEIARTGCTVLTFDGSCLFVPAFLRLPILYSRAATLCSCKPARYGPSTGLLSFAGIESEFAQRFMSNLEGHEVLP